MMNRNEKRRVPNRRLAELLVNEGLSPNQLAARIDVSGPTIRLALKGHVPAPRVQYEIASYFELRPTDLWPLDRQRVLA